MRLDRLVVLFKSCEKRLPHIQHDPLLLKVEGDFEPQPLWGFFVPKDRKDSLLNHSLLCNGQELLKLSLEKGQLHKKTLFRFWSLHWNRLPTSGIHCKLSLVYILRVYYSKNQCSLDSKTYKDSTSDLKHLAISSITLQNSFVEYS